MDGNARRPGHARGWLVALVLTALVAAVAVASTGSVPGGDDRSRRPAEQLVDTALSLFVVLLGVGAVAVLVGIAYLRKVDVSTAKEPSRRRSGLRGLAGLAAGLVLVLLAIRISRSRDGGDADGLLPPGLGGGAGSDEAPAPVYDPEFALWPVVAAVVLLLAVVLAVALQQRARRRALGRPVVDPAQEETLADVLDETLDDLRAEPDARRAVVGAYARMERALRSVGLPREPAEAPDEYLARIVSSLELSARTAGRLTRLFTWARFSGHDVAPEMKEQAIETLERARDELRAAAARREAEAEAALRVREASA